MTHHICRRALNSRRHMTRSWLSWQRLTGNLLLFVHVHFTCSLLLTLTLALTPTLGMTPRGPDSPPSGNLSSASLINSSSGSSGSYSGGQRLFNGQPLNTPPPDLISFHPINGSGDGGRAGRNNKTSSSTLSADGGRKARRTPSHPPSYGDSVPREFPVALVTAASVAAFCILVFFLLAYIWHTRQLDSRARKLAIRMAAEADGSRLAMGRGIGGGSEGGTNRCRNCGPGGGRLTSSSSSGRYTLAVGRTESNSSGHHDQGPSYEPLTPCLAERGGVGDDERGGVLGPESISGRSSVGVSESEAGDCEDVFEPATTLPGIPADRLRGLRAGGRGSHRKWNRPRKSGPPMEKRDSAVTDKEILTHFASRRHSTFFI